MNDTPSNLREVLAAASGSAAQSDLARWMASGARLLDTARARLLRAEHEHHVGRNKIIADAQRQLTELRQQTHEELRRFDIEHTEHIEQLREEIGRLEQMRDAGEWPARQ
jgi:RecA/RadA recombinase